MCLFLFRDKAEAKSAEHTKRGSFIMAFIFICPHCGTESSIDDALKGTESECPACCETVVLEPATERVCPHCGEKIKIMAKVCRFCHQPVTSQKDKLINSLKSGLAFVQSKVADGIEMAKKQIDSIRKMDRNVIADAGSTADVSETDADTNFFFFECPCCHKSIDAEKEWSGMEAECPECGETIIIPPAPDGEIAGMPNGSDDGKKRKKKIILISVLSAVIVAAVCVVYGLSCGDSDQGWATDEKTQKPPKQKQEKMVTVTAFVGLVPAYERNFKYTDSYCDIEIYAGEKRVHKTFREFFRQGKGFKTKITVPSGSVLLAVIKPCDQYEFKKMNRMRNVASDIVIASNLNSGENVISGMLGQLAAVKDGDEVYIQCNELCKE